MKLIIFAFILFFAYVFWIAHRQNKIKQSKMVINKDNTPISILDNNGEIVTKIDFKSFGYNSLGFSEPIAKGFLETLKKSNFIKSTDLIKISDNPNELITIYIAYECSICLLYASENLKKKYQYSDLIYQSMLKEFLYGINEGSPLFFNMKASENNAYLHDLFTKSFSIFSKYISNYEPQKIVDIFLIKMQSLYGIEFDPVGLLAIGHLFDPTQEMLDLSSHFDMSGI